VRCGQQKGCTYRNKDVIGHLEDRKFRAKVGEEGRDQELRE
jgi:hypothetical protein